MDCGILTGFACEGHSAERVKESLKFTCCSWVREETAGGEGVDEAEKEEQD